MKHLDLILNADKKRKARISKEKAKLKKVATDTFKTVASTGSEVHWTVDFYDNESK